MFCKNKKNSNFASDCQTCDGAPKFRSLVAQKIDIMKHFALNVELREELGKKATKKLRNEGKIPCVLYGSGENIHFFTNVNSVRKLIYTPEVMFVDIKIGDSVHYAILKQIQFHPVSDKILHIDFKEINEEKPVKIQIPVKVTGNSPGVRAGGKLLQKMRFITVEGLMADIPDYFEVNIDNLQIGDSIRIENLESDKLKFKDNKSSLVIAIVVTRDVAATTEENVEKATENEEEK